MQSSFISAAEICISRAKICILALEIHISTAKMKLDSFLLQVFFECFGTLSRMKSYFSIGSWASFLGLCATWSVNEGVFLSFRFKNTKQHCDYQPLKGVSYPELT